jgi:hypothetical protein
MGTKYSLECQSGTLLPEKGWECESGIKAEVLVYKLSKRATQRAEGGLKTKFMSTNPMPDSISWFISVFCQPQPGMNMKVANIECIRASQCAE